MCSSISWCVNRGDFKRRFEVILSQEDETLNNRSKDILRERYVNMVNKLEIHAKRASFWFLSLSTLTTVGSIVVPALISIQDKTFDVNSDEEEIREKFNIFKGKNLFFLNGRELKETVKEFQLIKEVKIKKI